MGLSLVIDLMGPALISNLTAVRDELYYQLSSEMQAALAPMMETVQLNTFSVVLAVVGNVGLLLCVITLHRLNNHIIRGKYTSGDSYSDSDNDNDTRSN